ENIDWNVAAKQKQERNLDNVRKYQSLKKKPVSIAQAKKNMIIYLKNMAGYKMEHFRGMTYDKVKPIFEREYKKVQTLFKPDKDVKEPNKKRVVKETLLQESFKKLKAVEVLGSKSTQEVPFNYLKEMSEEDEIHTEGSRTYWNIIRVGGITKACQSFEDMLKGFDKEDLVALWNLVKEKFSSAVPSVDKEKALWVELKRLFEPDADDVLWKLQRKYQSLKKKPVSIAQAKKNMIIYLKNMAGYKMEHFRGMTYDKVKPIFEREYKKVQTLFKPDKDVEEPNKKRVVKETLLQESFKKLKAVEVLGSKSTQEVPFNYLACKGVNATKPIVFDDEEVKMTMAQTLIKMKA
nr:hypothetical protein [Tanacetum cinerariifolium]